jgi:anti-sigma28 factor (negative regulator of flagellin synthesis)
MVVVVMPAECVVLSKPLKKDRKDRAALSRDSRAMQVRLLELRTAIESGEYGVSAAELTDALLRAARSAN